MVFNLRSYFVCTQVKESQYGILIDGLLKSGVTSTKDLHTTLDGIPHILGCFCNFKCYVSSFEKQLLSLLTQYVRANVCTSTHFADI